MSESVTSNEQLQRERDAWESTAAQFARNMEYYQGLVDRIGRAIGPMAYTADDGSVSDGVLRAKVPEIIERSLKALRRIGDPHMVYSSDEDSDEDTQLSMRMADARAVLSGDPSPVETSALQEDKADLLSMAALVARLGREQTYHVPAELLKRASAVLATLADSRTTRRHRGCGAACGLPAGHLGDHAPPEEPTEPYHGIGCAVRRGGSCNCAAEGKPEKASGLQEIDHHLNETKPDIERKLDDPL